MEALGAASSVFAVVSLSLQLSSNIQKIIEFWDSVKEAPDEIVQIKSQLTTPSELLRCIEAEIHDSTNKDPRNIGVKCLQVCNASVVKLGRVSKELDDGLNRSGVRRHWTCLRKAMREQQLASYWQEIERAKSMLIVYQGWNNGHRHDTLVAMMMRSTPAITRREIYLKNNQELLVSTEQQLLDGVSPITTAFLDSTTYEMSLSFGSFRVQISSHTTKPRGSQLSVMDLTHKRRRKEITASFIPGCVMSSAFECTLGIGFYSQMVLKCFNLRPGWSPIFRYSAEGDLYTVQTLIDGGSASIYDVDEVGWTPLHFAASYHQAKMCRMLIDMGAATNAVTIRLETPLLLATKRQHLTPRFHRSHRNRKDESSIDTIRILVQRAKNDPMQTDDIGYTSIMTASGDYRDAMLPWLLSQDDYEVDLGYKATTGHTTGAYISTRGDFPELLHSLLKRGININEPCAKVWFYRYGPQIALGAPSMIHYAVWVWYSKVLNMNDTRYPRGYKPRDSELPIYPLPAILSLLDHGVDLHTQTTSGYTILDGLLLNLLQFDGSARPQNILTLCFESWIRIVERLGFDIKDYIRHEQAIHQGISHDLGLDLKMELRFSENASPWAWGVFQGPEERERGAFMDHITKCCTWLEWQRRFALPKPPPPWPPTLRVRNPTPWLFSRASTMLNATWMNQLRRLLLIHQIFQVY